MRVERKGESFSESGGAAGSRYLDELRGYASRLGFRVEVGGRSVTVTYPNWQGMTHGQQASVSRCIEDLRYYGHYGVETVRL